MRIVRMRTLGMLGIGFLAGSRAGRGPWEKAQAGMDQIKDKVGGGSHGLREQWRDVVEWIQRRHPQPDQPADDRNLKQALPRA